MENILSLSKHYDNLTAYDSIVIEVKDPNGESIAVDFDGKVGSQLQLDNLAVPGWDGGPILIVISGYNADRLDPIYKEEKKYNGKTRVTEYSDVLVHPNPDLSTSVSILQLFPGQSIPLPRVTIVPENLRDDKILWTSDFPAVIEVRGAQLVAKSPGTARVTATLHYDTTKSRFFTVQVLQDTLVPANKPKVVITSPADSTLTNLDTISVRYTIDGVAGSQIFSLMEGTNQLVIAPQPDSSGNIGRDTITVLRDATPPLAPILRIRGKTPTNGNATWNWNSMGDNAGGSGLENPPTFRYQLNGDPWKSTSDTTLTITTDGTHTLVVQEQDRAGNWSPSSSSQVIAIDRQGPTVAISWPNRENYVTNRSRIDIQYSENNGAVRSDSCSLIEGGNYCRIMVIDSAGNPGRDSIHVYRRANVLFVTETGVGQRDGSDWENAMSRTDLDLAVKSPTSENMTFWLGAGTYLDMSVKYSVTLLGGFLANTLPHDIQNRNKTASRLGSIDLFTGITVSLDGFSMPSVSGGYDITLTMTDISMSSPPGEITSALYFGFDNAKITANNVEINNGTYSSAPVYVSNGILTFKGGSIIGNEIGENNPMWVGGRITLVYPFVISDNTNMDPNAGSYLVRLNPGGSLYVDPLISLSCEAAAHEVLIGSGGSCNFYLPESRVGP